jgi:hypothetical protein
MPDSSDMLWADDDPALRDAVGGLLPAVRASRLPISSALREL